MRIERPEHRFFLDVTYDPGAIADPESEPSVVVRGYLVEDVGSEIADTLTRDQFSAVDLIQSLKFVDNPFDGFPASYGSWVTSKAGLVHRLSTSAFNTLLWRYRVRHGPASLKRDPEFLYFAPVDGIGETVPLDDLKWRQVPAGFRTLSLPEADRLPIAADAGDTVSALLQQGEGMPLGHELLRAAWRIKEVEPRAALVMAVAAIETGVKEFAVHQSPETKWWVTEIHSPPVTKIIKELLPTLKSSVSEGGSVPELPQRWRRLVHSAVEKRNSIVHGRSNDVLDDELLDLLAVGFDILYYLDYHSGHEWAGAPAH